MASLLLSKRKEMEGGGERRTNKPSPSRSLNGEGSGVESLLES